jgi:hypothetical protein
MVTLGRHQSPSDHAIGIGVQGCPTTQPGCCRDLVYCFPMTPRPLNSPLATDVDTTTAAHWHSNTSHISMLMGRCSLPETTYRRKE